ncbi:DUF5691 domain-containing protein [Streptomyces thermolineatus]|uniref:DUF5691 domain-containing protein n=1 Tax=Streptomyces thermolineatus TaxID=44033 RepID=UPI00384D8EB9
MTTSARPSSASPSLSSAAAAPSWDDLVSTALLGVERRTPPWLQGADDPAAALLDLAAVRTVQRRAGLRPGTAAPLPEPARPDPRPELPPAARRRLALLLADRAAGGSGGRNGSAPNLAELLPQWLAAANAHGYRAPAPLLDALLDAARARSDLRPHALELAGPGALWLAALNPDWKFALRTTAPASPGAAPPPGPEERSTLWQEGLFAERVALLARLRATDPAAALELLRSTWAQERAEDRLMFVDALREGLSASDEPFLEEALSDRSRNVRATAAELLSALPGSALAARMASRALACVSAVPGPGGGLRLVVEAPAGCDAAMERDGVVARPPSGRGERSWWLGQLVDATPLSAWTEAFGLPPAALVELPVADDWQADLHAAWSRAAVRQRDAGWARALLGPLPEPAVRPAPVGDPARLLAVLPEEERAAWVARFVESQGLAESHSMLGVCAVPWSEPLGRAVVDALDIARDAGSYPWSFSGVMGLAERSLDPSAVDRVAPLAALPEETENGSPGAAGYWSEAFGRLAATLRLRATMLQELRPDPAAAP